MTDLMSPAGRGALRAAIAARALFGFDFDGTLAPIMLQPDAVQMDRRTATAFAALTTRADVAVITGRGVADVRHRLPGAPRWVIGNHGAEGMPDADPAALARAAAVCAAWRMQLGDGAAAAAATTVPGIVVEDKTYSLSLHYRQTNDHAAARTLLADRIGTLRPPPHVVDGKCVFNLLPAGANDKFRALRTLAGHAPAFFIGDDVTDETVFVQAPSKWVTVKVGLEPTAARFTLRDQAAVADCLELLLALTEESIR